MRLAGKEKAGYYPTPTETLKRIGRMIRPEKRAPVRLYDPCAGQGEALGFVAEVLRNQGAQPQTYAVELSPARATKAKLLLDEVIQASYEDITMSNDSISLLWLNPPYDFDAPDDNGKHQRAEYIFLQKNFSRLQVGGLLVYIIPLSVMGIKRVASYLASHFEQIEVYRLPGEEFEDFGQVVLFGLKRAESIKDEKARAQILAYSEENLPPELPEQGPIYEVPLAEKKEFFFRTITPEPQEIREAVAVYGAHTTKEWNLSYAPKDISEFRPLVPLKTGHIASLIASGQVGVVHLGDIVAKGRTIKKIERTVQIDAEQKDEKGRPRKTTIERDYFTTNVTIMNRAGEIRSVNDSAGLSEFIDQYGEQIGELVLQKYKPVYSGNMSEAEKELLAGYMKGRKLAGRKKTGLFTAQKHVVAAARGSLKMQGMVNIVGEMGSGKTAMAIALADVMGQLDSLWQKGPVAVMCPTHLVDKWAAEVTDVVSDAHAVIVEDLTGLQRIHKEWRPGDKLFVIFSKERAKLGPGWKHRYPTRKRNIAIRVRDQVFKFQANVITCPKCGKPMRDDDGNYVLDAENPGIGEEFHPFLTLAKNKKLRCTAPKQRWVGDPYDNTKGSWQKADEKGQPLLCNEPLWQYEGFRRWPLGDYIHDHMDGFFSMLVADEVHEYKAKDSIQGMIYHSILDSAKYVVNLTGTIFNGKSTSLFWLLFRNTKAVRDTYSYDSEGAWAQNYGRLERTYTGDDEDTAFSTKRKRRNTAKEIPGISPAIFAHLLPNTIFLRVADLGWKLPPCREEIIRVPMGEAQDAQYQWMFAVLKNFIDKGFKSWDSQSMKQATRLLSVWLQRGLGRCNTGFRRESVIWKAKEGPKREDSYQPFPVKNLPKFQLDDDHYYPVVNDPDAECLHLPLKQTPEYEAARKLFGTLEPMILDRIVAEDHILPKEQALLDIVQEGVKEGNKFLLYIRQTGDYDIQPRLLSIIQKAGLRGEILPRGVNPRNRDKWIKKHAKDIDVLLTNPEMVKTGLDLVQFNRAVYVELIYSLDTLWQSMKRIYRLGQTRETKIYYMAYIDTMEESALALMGQKLKAANMLYGDTADSAIADEVNDGNILQELAQRQLKGEKFSADGMSSLLGIEEAAEFATFEQDEEVEELVEAIDEMLGEQEVEQEDDWGEPEADSIFVVNVRDAWAEWLSQKVEPGQKTVVRKASRRSSVPENQIGLF